MDSALWLEGVEEGGGLWKEGAFVLAGKDGVGFDRPRRKR